VLSASRGKLWDDRPRGAALPAWLKRLSVPQRWFLHFYAAGALCNALALGGALLLAFAPTPSSLPALFASAADSCVSAPAPAGAPSSPPPGLPSPSSPPSSCLSPAAPPLAVADAEALAALLLFQAHLLRRLLETALLLKYPPGARMHAVAYAFGLSYYAAAPLSLLPRGWSGRARAAWGGVWGDGAAAAAAAAAGGGGGVSAAAAAWAVGAALASSEARRMHLAGALLFLAASALQLASHAALARLAAQAQRQQQQQQQRQKQQPARGAGAAAAAAAPTATPPPPPPRQLRDTPACRRRLADGRGEEDEERDGRGGERGRRAGASGRRSRSRSRSGSGSPSQSPPPPYLLPRGPLFALVSCPHYSAEVLLYAALALLTRLRAALPLLMAAWVAFNLALAGRATHAWYARRFGDAYERIGGGAGGGKEGDGRGGGRPWWRRRRALVPFVL